MGLWGNESLAGSGKGTGFSEEKESLNLPCELGTREKIVTEGASLENLKSSLDDPSHGLVA